MFKNPEFRKFVVKGAASLIISACIGFTYKQGKKLDARIDDYFDGTSESSDQDN